MGQLPKKEQEGLGDGYTDTQMNRERVSPVLWSQRSLENQNGIEFSLNGDMFDNMQ